MVVTIHVDDKIIIGELLQRDENVIKLQNPFQLVLTPKGVSIMPVIGINDQIEIIIKGTIMIGEADKELTNIYQESVIQFQASKSGLVLAKEQPKNLKLEKFDKNNLN